MRKIEFDKLNEIDNKINKSDDNTLINSKLNKVK